MCNRNDLDAPHSHRTKHTFPTIFVSWIYIAIRLFAIYLNKFDAHIHTARSRSAYREPNSQNSSFGASICPSFASHTIDK